MDAGQKKMFFLKSWFFIHLVKIKLPKDLQANLKGLAIVTSHLAVGSDSHDLRTLLPQRRTGKVKGEEREKWRHFQPQICGAGPGAVCVFWREGDMNDCRN